MKRFIAYTSILYSLLLATPYFHASLGNWIFVPIALVGSFLVISIGLMRHDHWHSYDRASNNSLLHNFYSYIILSDSNCYLHGHLSHHKNVHTQDDLEIYGPNYSKLTPAQKRRRFVFEIFLGNIHWEIITGHYLGSQQIITKKDVLKSLIARAIVIGALLALTSLLYGAGAFTDVLMGLGLSLWLGAVVSRHLQWIQHLGIFVDHKDPRQRGLQTRALINSGILERIFNLWTGTEGENHIIHHTSVHIPISTVRQMSLPENSPSIDLGEYMAVAMAYFNDPESGLRKEVA